MATWTRSGLRGVIEVGQKWGTLPDFRVRLAVGLWRAAPGAVALEPDGWAGFVAEPDVVMSPDKGTMRSASHQLAPFLIVFKHVNVLQWRTAPKVLSATKCPNRWVLLS